MHAAAVAHWRHAASHNMPSMAQAMFCARWQTLSQGCLQAVGLLAGGPRAGGAPARRMCGRRVQGPAGVAAPLAVLAGASRARPEQGRLRGPAQGAAAERRPQPGRSDGDVGLGSVGPRRLRRAAAGCRVGAEAETGRSAAVRGARRRARGRPGAPRRCGAPAGGPADGVFSRVWSAAGRRGRVRARRGRAAGTQGALAGAAAVRQRRPAGLARRLVRVVTGSGAACGQRGRRLAAHCTE